MERFVAPLPQIRASRTVGLWRLQLVSRSLRLFVLLAVGAYILGCGGGGAGSGTQPPPPPLIEVNVTPSSASVLLGGTVSFAATVTNSSNSAVTWSVNGFSGGSPQAGTISADGLYTAPSVLPAPGAIQVTATSQADPTKSGAASITVSSDVAVSISPSSTSAELGSTFTLHATIASNGHPDPTVHWALSGAACPASCGSIDNSGNYTAPAILPAATSVAAIATSVADPSKQATALIRITCSFALSLSAPNSVAAQSTNAVVATITPVAGSNPSNGMAWTLSGMGCSGSACGVLSVITTQSAGENSYTSTANYTAPATPPQPNSVVVTVTALADPSKKAQATIAVQPGGSSGSISLSPVSATLAANERLALTVTTSDPSPNLHWTVNGITSGNSSLGQICVSGSNPCQSLASTTALQADFLAPGAIPGSNPVTVAVTDSNNSLTSSSQITILNHVVVSVLPNNVTLPLNGVQNFSATVSGTSNQTVVWQVQGTGCAAGACGTINSYGTFTAPSSAGGPSSFQVVAISEDDTSQSGSATVSISNVPVISTLYPASVFAGAANGFTLAVDGFGFVSTTPNSSLIVAGSSRLTTCSLDTSCSAPITPADVSAPGTISVQVQNPGGSTSNSVGLVVVPTTTTEDVITLSSAAPVATGKDVTVVQLTSTGVDSSSLNLDIEVAALGLYTTSSNNTSCTLAGNPIPIVRPASGSITSDICLFSEAGFDAGMTYTVSGPGDIAVIAKEPAGLGIIHLTLQIPATAAAGARTIFIQNSNLDRTAASGALDVQ